MSEEEILNVPFLFGLEAQGHIEKIQVMLKEKKTWEEIGEEIGWCPKTAREHYEKWYWKATELSDREKNEFGTVYDVLAGACGLLEKFSKRDMSVYEKNEIAKILLFSNKFLGSKTTIDVE